MPSDLDYMLSVAPGTLAGVCRQSGELCFTANGHLLLLLRSRIYPKSLLVIEFLQGAEIAVVPAFDNILIILIRNIRVPQLDGCTLLIRV